MALSVGIKKLTAEGIKNLKTNRLETIKRRESEGKAEDRTQVHYTLVLSPLLNSKGLALHHHLYVQRLLQTSTVRLYQRR